MEEPLGDVRSVECDSGAGLIPRRGVGRIAEVSRSPGVDQVGVATFDQRLIGRLRGDVGGEQRRVEPLPQFDARVVDVRVETDSRVLPGEEVEFAGLEPHLPGTRGQRRASRDGLPHPLCHTFDYPRRTGEALLQRVGQVGLEAVKGLMSRQCHSLGTGECQRLRVVEHRAGRQLPGVAPRGVASDHHGSVAIDLSAAASDLGDDWHR